MFFTDARRDEQQRTSDGRSDVRSVVRRFGALHAVAGLLGLVGPAVRGNDDGGLVNVKPGLFLGAVAVNGRHALLQVLFGVLGPGSSGDAASARRYMGLNAAFFGLFAAVGWRTFGFERGVHMIGGMAVDGWGNLGQAIVAAFGLFTAIRPEPPD